MEEIITRGDLYFADLENQVIGSEQAGTRPVVIIQNNIGNYYSPTVIIAPITSKVKIKAKLPTHIILESDSKRLKKKSMILVEQIRVIDKLRLKNYIGALNNAELKALDKALIIALGIEKSRIDLEIEISKGAIDKEEKTEFITRRQIASYGIVAREYLKNVGNLEISNKLFGDYMLTLMDIFKPEQIENETEKYIDL